jgi:hypothetical protein
MVPPFVPRSRTGRRDRSARALVHVMKRRPVRYGRDHPSWWTVVRTGTTATCVALQHMPNPGTCQSDKEAQDETTSGASHPRS